ncbi:kinase-like domain-containing protein [Suillus americanus]|nr:kinase-like domain-containing protein [Suillus americanus]
MALGSDSVSIALDSDPAWPEPPLTPDLDTTPRQSTRFRATSLRVQGSPHSSHFSSDTGSTTESAPLVTPRLHVPPSPLRDKSFAPEAALLTSTTDTFGVGGRDSDSDEGFTLSLQKAYSQSQLQRLPGWISDAVSPLSEFMIDVDPQEYFADLQEIAEGESGSVYAARLVCPPNTLSLPPGTTHVAIKAITIHPAVSPKLQDLSHEMELMRGVHHDHVLCMDAFYVNLVDDSVWIRMELMERSLADVVGLVGEGLSLQERMIARFASDASFSFRCAWMDADRLMNEQVLLALEYLQKHHIAHRDVRSDNLLLNASGIVKVADFSNAVRVTRNSPMCFGAVGVIYWQAPEMRVGAYNALKVDVWSLGATVWELAQTEPPFADVQDPRQIGVQWPPLRQPELYSRGFHEFLKLCSRPYGSRPNPNELVNTPFIRNACGRAVNVQLLSQCRAIEEHMLQRESESGGES